MATATTRSSSSSSGVVSRRRHGSTSTLLLWILCCCCFCESSRRVVSHLPGFDGPLPFHLETGYVEVDELAAVRLFYYFIRSERRPADDPVVLWLTGGPGCSALSGLIYEVGPLTFDFHGGHGLPKLMYKADAWTKVSSVIFLDSPVGTGFSYAGTEQGYRSSDTKAVHQILVFLTKWFADEHPELLPNPLYIAGDSYSGMIVPTLAFQIATRKAQVGSEEASPLTLNLKGYLVGNPVTDDIFDNPSKIPFAHGMGLISDEMYQAYKTSCSLQDDQVSNSSHQSTQCTNTLDAIDQCVKGIYPNHVLEPYCTFASPYKQKQRMRLLYSEQDHLQLSRISSECRTEEYIMSRTWANNDTVREALGIHKGTVPWWQRCNYDILYSYDIPSSVRYHLGVATRGYRSLIYSGDHDMVIPFIGTQAWIRSLNFSVVDDWRPWIVDGQVAGYTRSYSNNLTFATVKGGGHTAPEYMPRQCFAMFSRWLASDPL